MAGFFRSFQKPGKGVSKEEIEKKRFFLFFELLWRKLFQLIGLNILYFIVILPLCAFLSAFVLQSAGIGPDDIEPNMLLMLFGMITNLPDWLTWTLIFASAALYGPATAGVTYVMRNYTRREPVFMFVLANPVADAHCCVAKNFRQLLSAGCS